MFDDPKQMQEAINAEKARQIDLFQAAVEPIPAEEFNALSNTPEGETLITASKVAIAVVLSGAEQVDDADNEGAAADSAHKTIEYMKFIMAGVYLFGVRAGMTKTARSSVG